MNTKGIVFSLILNFLKKNYYGKKILDLIYQDKINEKFIINEFHKLYYDNAYRTWHNTFWLGKQLYKLPLDLWIYQEIIYDLKPDLIIECGTYKGGSTLFFASLCDLLNKGKIFTIDIENREERPQHKRIQYILGSSTFKTNIDIVRNNIKEKDTVIVFLDSDHEKIHVLEELKVYSKLVTKGSYLIVEDSNLNGHPVYNDFGPGPMEAIEEFLKINNDFIIDKTKEKFYFSQNPKGYLKKMK